MPGRKTRIAEFYPPVTLGSLQQPIITADPASALSCAIKSLCPESTGHGI
jgi:hypothetical protein